MKRILSFFLLFIPLAVFSQTSICGVDFGASYTVAERILENKFGDKDILLSDKTRIVFRNQAYAGRQWSSLNFIFQSDGYQQFMNRCILVREFSTVSEAEDFRDDIITQMGNKYFIMDFKDEKTGLTFYCGGESSTDKGKPGFCIDILKYKSGEYAVRLDYGPYNYVKEEL